MRRFLPTLGAAIIGLAVFLARPVQAETHKIIFPVIGPTSYSNDFGAPRVGHTHEGNDIFAPKHTPLVAAADGRIQYITWPEASYGYFISLQGDDGYEYWYIHVNNDNPGTDDDRGGGNFAYAPGVDNGAPVVKGQLVGWVGDSGNAEGTSPHLHFEIHRPDGTVINPFYSLNAATHISRPVIAPPLPGEFLPFGEFRGGANIVLDDLDPSIDGIELIAGAGLGGGPLVRVLNSSNGQISKFYAYDQLFFHGGVDVAVGDINADGTKEIITVPGPGTPPYVRVFTEQGLLLSEFLAYPATFLGGAHVAAADLDGDGQAEIITSPGPGISPEVRIFRFNGDRLASWNAYTSAFKGGVDVSAVPFDATTNQVGLVVTGALRGGGPEVRTFSMDGTFHAGFYAYDKLFHGGVRVSAHRFTDGSLNIITAPYSGGGGELRQFSENGQLVSAHILFERWWRGGFDVAAAEDRVIMSTSNGGRRASIRTVGLIVTPPPPEVPPVQNVN